MVVYIFFKNFISKNPATAIATKEKGHGEWEIVYKRGGRGMREGFEKGMGIFYSKQRELTSSALVPLFDPRPI